MLHPTYGSSFWKGFKWKCYILTSHEDETTIIINDINVFIANEFLNKIITINGTTVPLYSGSTSDSYKYSRFYILSKGIHPSTRGDGNFSKINFYEKEK